MRFIMVMAIVLCHFDFLAFIGKAWDLVISRPDPAVAFFFILSGFGLEYAQKEYGYSSVSIKFAVDRIKKIYPIYLFSILLCIPVTLYFAISLHGLTVGVIRTIIKIPLVLVLLQSITGMAGFSHAFNGVCWFISTLFILYTFYPLLHMLNIRLKLAGGGIILLLLISALVLRMAIFIIFHNIENTTGLGSYFDDLSYGSPYFRIFDFILGMLLFNYYSICRKYHIWNASILEIAVTVLFVSYYIFRDFIGISSVVQIALDAFLPVLWIFVFSFEKGCLSKFMSHQHMVKLGGLTMYIFLFHYVAVLYVKALLDYFPIISLPFFTVSLSLLLIVVFTCLIMITWEKINVFFKK